MINLEEIKIKVSKAVRYRTISGGSICFRKYYACAGYAC